MYEAEPTRHSENRRYFVSTALHIRDLVAFLALVLLGWSPAVAQVPPSAPSTEATFSVSSRLVLVDVISRNVKTGLPDNTLKQGDFELFDKGHPVPIATFDSGANFATRPITLWFVVLCNMRGWEAKGSGLFARHTSLFTPALKYLDKNDTVAVAHWCDNGHSDIDLLPTKNSGEAITALEHALEPMPYFYGGRTGENALQKTLQLIIAKTTAMKPEPVPVVVFLYGDWSAMPSDEADSFVDQLLATSAIVFGIEDRESPTIGLIHGEQEAVAHYLAEQTGGQYLAATPETYAAALGEILQQLLFRYELGFKPLLLDGKRHKLTVKLAKVAEKEHPSVQLRCRPEYIPVK
jgi:hypothetical protein